MKGRGSLKNLNARSLCIIAIVGLSASACGSTTAVATSTTSTTVVTSKIVASTSTVLATAAKRLFPQGLTIVSDLPPGGVTYSGAEAIQPFLQKTLQIPVTIRPVLGGGGNTGSQYVYNSAPNSGILHMTYLPQMAIGEIVGDGRYKLLKYTPLAGLFGNDTSIYVSKYGSPLKSFASLKTANRTITIGVFGVKTSAGWMSAEFLSKVNDIRTATVPYANAAQSIDGVLSGAVDLASVTRAQALPLIAEKRIQAVVEFAPRPLSFLPGVDSIAQVGASTEAFYNVLGIDGPPKMSSAAKQVLRQALAMIAKEPTYIAQAKKVSLAPIYEDSTAWTALESSAYNFVRTHLSTLNG